MILRRGGLGAGCAFLEKPFTREALFEKIQEARGREVSQD
jgi:FixJ family two-component response regulator